MNFKPVSMPCTEEQWLNEVKPLCDKYGLYYPQIEFFIFNKYLVNNLGGNKNKISILPTDLKDHHNRTVIPYNPIEFIRCCGVNLEETEQPKWEKLTTKDETIEDIIYFHGWYIVKIKLLGFPILYNEDGIPNNAHCVGNLIPYNPRKIELLTKKAELEKQLEEINNQLNTK